MGAIQRELREQHPACFSHSTYPLHDSFIYDTGADTHVCNNRDRYQILYPLKAPEYLRAGNSVVAIRGFGVVRVYATTPSGEKAPITLHNVAYIPDYHTSLISHDILKEKSGAYLDGKRLLICTADDAPFCILTRAHRQLVVEHNEPSGSAFAVKRSREPLKATGTALQWHHRLGHPGPQVIANLPLEAEVLEPSSAPSTTECEPCALAKATNLVSRRPMALPDHPYQRISIDWFSYEQAFNGLTGCTIIKCDLTSVTTVVPGEGKNTIGPAITQLDTRVHRQYGFCIC